MKLYLKGTIRGAFHADRGTLDFWIDPASEYYRKTFQPDRRYILYCAGGGRSALATKTIKDMGYTDAPISDRASEAGSAQPCWWR